MDECRIQTLSDSPMPLPRPQVERRPSEPRRKGSGRVPPKMVSYAVVVPVETMQEVERLQKLSGLAKTHFIAGALVMGARRFSSQLNHVNQAVGSGGIAHV